MRKLIGQLLIGAGFISEKDLHEALEMQKRRRKKVGQLLLEMDRISENDLGVTVATQVGSPYVDLDTTSLEPHVIGAISQELAESHCLLPIAVGEDSITVAMANPADVVAIDDVRAVTGLHVKPVVAAESAIREAISRYYHLDREINSLIRHVAAGMEDIDILGRGREQENHAADLRDAVGSAPVVRLVNMLLMDAVRSDASDVHIESAEKSVQVRYRIDGSLIDKMTIPKYLQAIVISRVKVLADMDIAERRKPQDGRIKTSVGERNVDLRVSSLPTLYGEKIVIRILDQSRGVRQLDDAGFSKRNLTTLRKLLRRPQGMLLVTGPTGSGKTTTLYAALTELKDRTKNIVTVEDPIEYALKGINQVQANEKAGVTFATALRSILRQDPDIVMLGEIRDLETAEIAFRASLTGHLVLSTLHTNDAVSAITRLMDIGVERYLIASSVIGVVAQRLARMICGSCKERYEPTEAEKLILDPARHTGVTFYRGGGCAKCNQTGYRGRTAIGEILSIDSSVRDEISAGGGESTILEVARRGGMRSMREDGLEKVVQGITTLEEVIRLTLTSEDTESSCSNCKRPVKSEFQVCPYCQEQLGPHRCHACGRIVNDDWSLCPYCRAELKRVQPATGSEPPRSNQVSEAAEQGASFTIP